MLDASHPWLVNRHEPHTERNPIMPFQATLGERPAPREIRESLLAAGEYLAGLQQVPREQRDASWIADTRSATEHIHGWDPVLMAFERGYGLEQGGGPTGATALVGNERRQSAGQLVTGLKTYEEFAEKRVANATFFETEIRGSLLVDNREVRTLLDSDTNSGTGDAAGIWRPVGSAYETPPRVQQARLFVRDVISVQGTNLASVPYIRELSATTHEFGASSVAEGTTKPEVTMLFEQDDAPVRKIAAWIPATEEIIDDAPTLRGYIDNRLAYMLALREEFEIINGSGVNPRLKGILQFAGLQSQSFSTDVPTTVGLAIGKIEAVDGTPDGVAMNPNKFWAMMTTRNANQFDGGFGVGAPFGAPMNTLWGLPVIRSRVLTLNQCIVGSWRLGATLFDKLQTTIRVGNQHSTYFVENKVAILAEERVALAVHRPDFFVNTTLA